MLSLSHLHPGRPLNFVCLLMFSFCLFGCTKKNDTVRKNRYAEKILDHASSLIDKGQLKRAIFYLDSAYQGLEQIGVYDNWAKYSFKSAYFLNYEANPGKAILYADSMLVVLNGLEKEYPEEYVSAVLSKGEALTAQAKYAMAFKYYYDARLFARKYLDSCAYSALNYRLGLVRFNQKNYAKAIPYFKQAFEYNKRCKINDGFINLFIYPQSQLNTLALCYERSGMPDTAVYYYKKALSFMDDREKQFPDKLPFISSARGVVYGNLGGTYATLGKFKEAEWYLKRSISINNRVGYAMGDAQTAQLKLAALYLKRLDFKAVDTLLSQIEEELARPQKQNLGKANIRLNWYKLKWAYFDQTSDVPAAYRFSKKYYALKDSIDLLDQGKKNADLDEGFRDTAQQYHLALLSKNNQLKTTYIWIVVVVALMVIALLLLVYRNLKSSRKNVKELTDLYLTINHKNAHLQNALSALEQSQEENSRMMKMVAHDLRNPIGGITALTDILLEEGGHSAGQKEMLQLIRTSGQNSMELINDLLQNSRREILFTEAVDMNAMLHYCVELLEHKAKEKGQQIELETGHLTLLINREKMWRVISNLIANAIKFSPRDTRIFVQMQVTEHHALILVKDQGIGIPMELRDKLFDMFTEANRPGTEGEQSFGMGLAISKQIVEVHGGEIWFESAMGKGTVFYVKLPLQQPDQS